MSQAFDGTSFVDVAESLHHDPQEESLRTSVGRSYYGVFWKAREYASNREGPALSHQFNKSGAHAEVRRYFEQNGRTDRRFRRVAYDLRDLINARHSVDYERLYSPRNCSLSNDAPFFVAMARNTISEIDQLPS